MVGFIRPGSLRYSCTAGYSLGPKQLIPGLPTEIFGVRFQPRRCREYRPCSRPNLPPIDHGWTQLATRVWCHRQGRHRHIGPAVQLPDVAFVPAGLAPAAGFVLAAGLVLPAGLLPAGLLPAAGFTSSAP